MIKNYSLVIFSIIFFCMSIYKGISLDGNAIYDTLFILYFVYVVFKYITLTITKKEFVFLCVLILLSCFNFFKTGSMQWITTTIILIGTKGIDLKYIMKILFYTKFITYVSVILLAFINIIPNKEVLTLRGDELVYRLSYGFNHPNELHSFFFIIVVIYIYIYYYKLNIFSYIFILLLNYILYYYSYARTGYYLVIISVLLTVLVKHSKIFKKMLLLFTNKIQIILVIFILLMATIFYGNKLFYFLDSNLNGRLYYAKLALTDSLSLFGMKLDYFVNKYILFFHDNSYATTLALSGIIIFILIIFMYYITANNLIVKKDYPALLLFFLLSLLFFSEDYMREPFINITLFFIYKMTFEKKV